MTNTDHTMPRADEAFFYIKDSAGRHIGGIALMTRDGLVGVAGSLCSRKDDFSKHVCRAKTLGRLRSTNVKLYHKAIYRGVNAFNCGPVLDDIGLFRAVAYRNQYDIDTEAFNHAFKSCLNRLKKREEK